MAFPTTLGRGRYRRPHALSKLVLYIHEALCIARCAQKAHVKREPGLLRLKPRVCSSTMGLFDGLFPAANEIKSTLFSSDSIFRRPATQSEETSNRKMAAASIPDLQQSHAEQPVRYYIAMSCHMIITMLDSVPSALAEESRHAL